MRKVAKVAVVAGSLVVGCLTAGSVVARDAGASDEQALAPTRHGPSRSIEQRVDRLLARMTTQEKLQQVQLLSDGQITDADAKAGVGGVFSLTDPAKIDHYQRIAMTQSRLHIPILFAYDTIHGYRTIFPVPLGAASSFDPDVARTDAQIGARESATVGIKQIYSPMVDVSHDPRWGRIVEGNGEDPYLGSVMAAARVKGAQGNDYSRPDRAVTSVKHFVGYGEPEGGRDYGTTDMSEQRLRNLYLPPFKAAIEAGADTVMCSFNAINGVPGCANRYTETEILKKEWGFDGFIESDYTAVAETRVCPPKTPDEGSCGHGTAADGPEAGANALMAGTDSEMVSTYLRDYGKQLLADGRISRKRLDDAVRRILRVKFRAGLFENPYVDQAKATDPASFLTPADRRAARTAAARSMVLLQNKGRTLPLDPAKKTAVIGPLADNQHDLLGAWWGRGEDADAVSVLKGITDGSSATTTYAQGCALSNEEPPDYDPADDCPSDAGFAKAVAAANDADQVVLALGETREMSGEAASRSRIDLPGRQQELIDAIAATGKPFVVVLFNGRPLTLSEVVGSAPAVLEAWFPGVEGGNAVADVVFGKVNPGGKLPVSFPQRLGQVPIYYNHEPTGRPCDVTQKYTSRYRDLRSCDPLFPFGFGLSYTSFTVSDLTLSKTTVSRRGSVVASVKVTNTGSVAGDDVAQVYLRDPVASISQPVRRLRGFERVTLRPGQSTTVRFTLDASDFGFYDNRGRFVVEPGTIQVYAGDDSTATLSRTFRVTR
ncbi:beta-glucosidase BglX [Aeromicrobium chenweiae]|uniref:Exo-alpha-(1->6)-L-arabinopyranosidase n=1 Tax=Aeromicrobium chenweiae TaxID=2079793 RepID=A0A2S0WLB4_9ACTN|nr:beta-glucosidase BglX [Aeromicrobium chenweiae]AWB92097.1 beta-glucosidase BglX [Aeromicrobium chenweiae]TGN32946.1 beta-glucosidase BglX [Aeromicrobium chenweiae]